MKYRYWNFIEFIIHYLLIFDLEAWRLHFSYLLMAEPRKIWHSSTPWSECEHFIVVFDLCKSSELEMMWPRNWELKNYRINKNKGMIMSWQIHTQYLTIYVPGFWIGVCAKKQGKDKDDYVQSLHGFAFLSLLMLQDAENISMGISVLMRQLSNL